MANEKRQFRTTKVLSGVQTNFRAWKEWAEGDTLVCKLLGSKQNSMNASKKDWIVEVVEVMFEDRAANKKFPAGSKLTLNPAGQLDKGIEQLQNGEMFQVTYNGHRPMAGGKYKGKMAHTMEVIGVSEDLGDEDIHDDDQDEDMDRREDEDEEDL